MLERARPAIMLCIRNTIRNITRNIIRNITGILHARALPSRSTTGKSYSSCPPRAEYCPPRAERKSCTGNLEIQNAKAQFGASRQESLVEDSGKNSRAQNVQILIKKLGDFNVFFARLGSFLPILQILGFPTELHRQFGDTKRVGPIWRFAPRGFGRGFWKKLAGSKRTNSN